MLDTAATSNLAPVSAAPSGFNSQASTRAPSIINPEKQDLETTPEYSESRSPSPPLPTKEDVESQHEPVLSTDDDMDYPHGVRLVGIVLALIVSVFLVALDMTIVATAIPKITDQFHSLDDVAWYGSAFFLTLASFQSTWGKIYRYFPLKISFLSAIFIFEVGSLICGVANDSKTLIVGRAIAGLGGAGIASGAYTIIAFSAPPRQRPVFTGILGATYGGASVIGPLLGGVFTQKVSWRWCFYINLPVGGLAAAIIILTFTAPPQAKPMEATRKEKFLQMDFIGTFTIMAAVVCYILALQWGGITKAWSDSDVIGTLVGFVLLLIVFGINEYYQGERALLMGRLLNNRIVIVACSYVILLAGSFFILLYYLPVYFQSVDGVSPSRSGIDNVPLVIGVSLATIVSGGLISSFGHYVPLMIAGSALATIGSGLIYTLDIGTPSSHWIGYQALVGIGLGLGFQVPIIVAQATSKPEDISAVSAIVLFFQTVGGSFFVSAGEAAYENKLLGTLAANAPGVSPATVLAVGQTGLREAFNSEQLAGVLKSYVTGLQTAFIIAIASAGASFFVAFASPWQRIDAKKAQGAA